MATASTVPDVMASDPSGDSSDVRLLFCPFCRECYEGRAQCPEHELELVEFQALPRQAHEREMGWEDPVLPWDIRFGRLELMLGVVAAVIGFFVLPLVAGTFDDEAVSWTAMDIALRRAPNLWTVPFVAALFVMFLHRRRTPLQMRGARLAGVALGVMAAVSLVYSLWQVHRGILATQGAVAAGWGAGAWIIGGASLLFVIGSLRFGAIPTDASLPHGAAADEGAASRIESERTEAQRIEAQRIEAQRPAKRKRKRR